MALALTARRSWLRTFNRTLTRTGNPAAALRRADARSVVRQDRTTGVLVKERIIFDINSLAFDQKDAEALLLDADFWAGERSVVMGRLEPKMRAIFNAGIEAARGINVRGYRRRKDFLDPPLEPLEDYAEQVFRLYTDNWWEGIEATTREALREAIIKSGREGTGVKAVIKEIQPLFGKVRARRIGVTETTRLFGQGAQATYAASGLEEWVWQTVEDGRVCPTCDALSGNVYPIDMTFNPAHVTCRCFPSPQSVGRRSIVDIAARLLRLQRAA